jgi:hypothetical protein
MPNVRSAGLFTVFAILSVLACGDDNPTSSGDDDGGGNGVDATAPAAVADLHTDSPTTTSIALVWTAPGDDGDAGTASEYDVRYSTSPITEASWEAATLVDGEPPPKPAGEIETIRVLNLETAEDYYFVLKTSDEIPNVSGLSNVVHDSTNQETAAPDTISDLAAEGFDDGMFRLTWTAPGDDGNLGDASVYDIRYSTSRITEDNWGSATGVDGEPSPATAGSPDTMVVTGLDAATNYFFAMKTADEVPNWSAISNLSPALANGNDLWIFPDRVQQGSSITIIYRTPPSGWSKLHAHYRNEADQWARLAIEWERTPGIYSREWDFRRGSSYHDYPYTFYTLKLYWNSVVVADTLAWLER